VNQLNRSSFYTMLPMFGGDYLPRIIILLTN